MSGNQAYAISEHDNVVLKPLELFNGRNLKKKTWESLKCHRHRSVDVSHGISG